MQKKQGTTWLTGMANRLTLGWIRSEPLAPDRTARIEHKRAGADDRAAGGGGNAGRRRRTSELRRTPSISSYGARIGVRTGLERSLRHDGSI
jgi:hypothetical protein